MYLNKTDCIDNV